MVPVLRGLSVVPRDFIYTEYCKPNENRHGWGQAVRVGNWSAVCVGPKPKGPSKVPACNVPLLYDLSTDPGQLLDLSADHPELVAHVLAIMKREHTQPPSFSACGAVWPRAPTTKPPSSRPTTSPTQAPTPGPTAAPTVSPTAKPTAEPTAAPTTTTKGQTAVAGSAVAGYALLPGLLNGAVLVYTIQMRL